MGLIPGKGNPIINIKKQYHMNEEEVKYIMKRTSILCPSCFKKKIIEETKDHAYCDECGQTYVITEKNNVKFK